MYFLAMTLEMCKLQFFLQNIVMRGNNYNSSPVTPRTRLERLLRERELRKSSRFSQPSAEATAVNREAELPANDPCLPEGDHSGLLNEEELLEGIAATRAFADGCQRQDVRPTKQRLLVVANRLPVSAIRRGEDLWQLEMSVGGLVSALLGK